MKDYCLTIPETVNDEKLKLLRENASPEVIRVGYMQTKLLFGYEVSFDEIHDIFDVSLSTFNKDIKGIRLSAEVLFGDEAAIVKTKKEKTYVLAIPVPRLRLKLGF